MFSSRIIEDISVWAKFVALVIAVHAAIIRLFKAVFEIRANREQRATELRWKQANTAKELLNDIHEHGLEKNAIHLLDWCEGKAEYEIAPGTSETLVADLCARSLAYLPCWGILLADSLHGHNELGLDPDLFQNF